MRGVLLGAVVLAALAVGFFGTLAVLDLRSKPGTVVASRPTVAKEAMRCEVHLPQSRCPAQKDFKGVAADGIIYDNWEGTASNMANCLARAEQFYNWCKNSEPVVARFFRDHNMEGQLRFPIK